MNGIPNPKEHKFYNRISCNFPPVFDEPHPRITICILAIPKWEDKSSEMDDVKFATFKGVAICSEEDSKNGLCNRRIGRQVALYKALEKYSKWVLKQRAKRNNRKLEALIKAE